MKPSKCCQKGRSMVEILGVLALVGVLSVGGLAAYAKAMEKFNITKVTEDVHFIIRSMQAIYSSQKDYKDLDNAAAIDYGVIPDHMIVDRTTIRTKLGDEVTIKSIGRNSGWVLLLNKMKTAPCVALGSTDWGKGSSGLAFMVISQTGVVPPRGFPINLDAGEYSEKDLPLSPDKVAPFCMCNKEFGCGIAWFFR